MIDILQQSSLISADAQVLHFSPSAAIRRKLQKASSGYISSDYLDEFGADVQYDITNIPEPNDKFDLIVCYHVLEHIEQDEKAMQELFRVLKRGGTAILQTPFKSGEIYENSDVISPEDRLTHFGQADHVRIYSTTGLLNRLQGCGFKTELLTFDTGNERLGFKVKEKVILARK